MSSARSSAHEAGAVDAELRRRTRVEPRDGDAFAAPRADAVGAVGDAGERAVDVGEFGPGVGEHRGALRPFLGHRGAFGIVLVVGRAIRLRGAHHAHRVAEFGQPFLGFRMLPEEPYLESLELCRGHRRHRHHAPFRPCIVRPEASGRRVRRDNYDWCVVTALYRRYRPETFAEMIGQSQVTEPLMTALRTDRVNHAYLFSGPRGCGKTTSARILARCLNCAEGPTDVPCGVCPSCIELSRGGGGSLDVVEIDAASHNGVDDARDLRERAVFAPARDRYKIFILDEAHMVTPQGFNALLKLVEEPPDHVKFIFATTEPDKVLGTIRSRTHHYPFRLVPPGPMLEYVQQLCTEEGVEVAPGVLPLVVRAGGGSPRDTLSLLDQLIAGSEGTTIDYERAVALLGYTHGALLDEVVDAIGANDAAGAFAAADRVVQTGQDPRRFVEDLLERLRDLIVVAASSPETAAAVLRGVPEDELARMAAQAAAFGQAELSRVADLVNQTLTEMTGATSPRLHLELMLARVLVPSADDSERGALARVERLERRVGVSDAVGMPCRFRRRCAVRSSRATLAPARGAAGRAARASALRAAGRAARPAPLRAAGRAARAPALGPAARSRGAGTGTGKRTPRCPRDGASRRAGHPPAVPRRVARGARVAAAHEAERVDGGVHRAGARVPR